MTVRLRLRFFLLSLNLFLSRLSRPCQLPFHSTIFSAVSTVSVIIESVNPREKLKMYVEAVQVVSGQLAAK